MNKIIPGYFIPIWQDIIMNRREFIIKLLSNLTLIPYPVLRKAIFCNNEEESKTYKTSDIRIYTEYKYCILEISKDYYKRLARGDATEDIDFAKRFTKKLKICISFEDESYFMNTSFVERGMVDYGFLHIGIRYIKALKRREDLGNIEKMLLSLVVDNWEDLKKYDDYDIRSVIDKYQHNKMFFDWFRTYQEYLNCSNLLDKEEDSLARQVTIYSL